MVRAKGVGCSAERAARGMPRDLRFLVVALYRSPAMSAVLADSVSNPYATPRIEAAPAPVAAPAKKPGSLGMIFGGFVLLLLGYFTSNLLLISDLYKIGIGPNGQPVPSPFAMATTTPAVQWLLY